jgi:hypothetical protein
MSKTTSTPKKAIDGKAAVKSGELDGIYLKLRHLLAKHTPPLTATIDQKGKYELISDKPSTFLGRKRDNLYFGAAVIKSNYVGLYLMHLYVDPQTLATMDPQLRKLLKGKSCIHIKKLDDDLMRAIEETVVQGIALYRKHGLI